MTKDQEFQIVAKELDDVFQSLKAYFPKAKSFHDVYLGIEKLQIEADEYAHEEAMYLIELERGYAHDRI